MEPKREEGGPGPMIPGLEERGILTEFLMVEESASREGWSMADYQSHMDVLREKVRACLAKSFTPAMAYQDSIEIGTAGKNGAAVKVYFNASKKEEAADRIRNALELRDSTLGLSLPTTQLKGGTA